MAKAAVHLEQALSCTICLTLLKEPLPCGHNFCRSCIQSYWDGEEQSSCPQCRQRFAPRPVLVTNTTSLVELVEHMKRTELQHNPVVVRNFFLPSGSDPSFEMRQRQQQACMREILCTIQVKETALQKLQQEVLSFRHCADETVRHSEQSLTALVQVLEYVHSEVSREVRALQEREEGRLRQLHDQLQQGITNLRLTASELDTLTPGQTLQHCPPSSASDSPRTYSVPLGSLEQAASAVTALSDQVKVTLSDGLQKISQGFRANQHPLLRLSTALPQSEPKTREEFINYAREIILDPNTAHQFLSLSRGNRGAAMIIRIGNSPPDHPDRFSLLYQVLSREGLMGRCYWEVEWTGYNVVIAVSYKSIGRKGNSEESDFGYNDKSWALDCKKYGFSFWHHSVETKVSRSVSERIGVYVDHSAGVLAFYNIDKNQTMNLLHKVQATFTQPLFAGVKLSCKDESAHFPKFKY